MFQLTDTFLLENIHFLVQVMTKKLFFKEPFLSLFPFKSNKSIKFLVTHCPADSRLVGWSVGRLVGWSAGRLVGWLVGWSVGRLVGQLVG